MIPANPGGIMYPDPFFTRSMLLGSFRDVRRRAFEALKWLLWLAPMSAAVGSACALFAWSLDRATQIRFEQPWLLYLLPLAGVLIAFLYDRYGRPAEGGNNLILDQIHEPGGGVPRRMAPLILVTTVITHLFGGSGGREGTAVQMGGSIASALSRWFRLGPENLRTMLMAGVAAGFGAIFGAPLAGAIFALEVLSIGRFRHHGLLQCLFAALAGNWVCHAWGIAHTRYTVTFSAGEIVPGMTSHFDPWLLAKILVASAAFGLCGAFFAEISHTAGRWAKRLCPRPLLRPVIGGLILIALVHLLGTREYLGLGVWSPDPGDLTLPRLFGSAGIVHSAWFWKLAFTVITLSTGFKGGEVTPLFFIGAALGNSLAGLMGAPVDLFAALGFVAIFAAASNTPLASAVMGIELFGSANAVYLALACFVAWACSGRSTIYASQR